MNAEENVGDGYGETAEFVVNTGVNRIPKQNFKKPNKLEEHATLKDFEDWKGKLNDYYTLTGIDKFDDKV